MASRPGRASLCKRRHSTEEDSCSRHQHHTNRLQTRQKTLKRFRLNKSILEPGTSIVANSGRVTMSLKDIIVATQADLRANADHAIATFAADSRQVEGLR